MPGAWNFVHGHSGTIEEPDAVYSVQRKGWGLCFWQRAGTHNWVHFAVPSNAQFKWRVDYLQLKFTAGEYGRLCEIDLWDGNVKLLRQSTHYVGGEIDTQIHLDREWEISGALGVSLKIEADAAGDAHFMFHAVGANFRQ